MKYNCVLLPPPHLGNFCNNLTRITVKSLWSTGTVKALRFFCVQNQGGIV